MLAGQGSPVLYSEYLINNYLLLLVASRGNLGTLCPSADELEG